MSYTPTDLNTGTGDTGEITTDLWNNLMDFVTFGMAERWRWEAEREIG